METQLVERYLRAKQRTHGLYVVGWFGQTSGSKTSPLQKVGREAAQALLARQAAALSNDGLHVQSYLVNYESVPGRKRPPRRPKSPRRTANP